jgi:hypothetical protein
MEQTALATTNIDRLTTEILILKQQTAQNIIEIGKRLIAVKEELPYGQWGKWLAEKVEFSQEHARRFMKIAEEFSDSTSMWNLPPTKVFALLDVPPEDREQFVAEHDIDNMSVREMQQVIKERDQALKEKEEALKQAKYEHDRSALIDQTLNTKERDVTVLQDNLSKEREYAKETVTKLQTSIGDLQKKLKNAQSAGNDDETAILREQLTEANKDLSTSADRIDKLEAQLKAKPIETATTVIEERIPEDVQKELTELRKQSPAVLKFRVHFDELTASFRTLLEDLAEIPQYDRPRYRGAVSGLIGKMSERL